MRNNSCLILLFIIVILVICLWSDSYVTKKMELRIDSLIHQIMSADAQIMELKSDHEDLHLMLAREHKTHMHLLAAANQEIHKLTEALENVVPVIKEPIVQIPIPVPVPTNDEKLKALQKASKAAHDANLKARQQQDRADSVDAREHRQQMQLELKRYFRRQY